MAVHIHEVLRSFVESEGLFFAYKFPVAAKGAVENHMKGSSDDERSSEISCFNSESKDGAGNSSVRSYSSSCESASSSCRSTGRNIEQLENGDYKSSGSNDEAELNDEHIVISEIKRVFDTCDENGDGYICKSDLEKFMRKLDVHILEDEISCMIESVDVNGDGYVDFKEFLELHIALTDSEEFDLLGSSGEEKDDDEDAELLEAFQVFDKNQDGFISVTELQTVRRNLGINPTVKAQDCQRMISAVDRNNDGQVDFLEFKHFMAGFPSIACAA